ncbi:MAG: hypothetical protein FD128_1165 [Hyphomonadaceae bacterium]|nr:MAG: hypothetical protein FD128_1165 [Hyphomonadaceae bacterium]
MRGGGLRALSSFVAFVAALGLPMDALWSQNGIAGDMFSPAAYVSWGVMAEKNQADVDKFERFLAHNGVGNVLPTYQILRTASMAGVCNESAFYVPPQKFWPNIVGSAHAKYFALDLVPTSNIGRKELIARICKAHREYGPEFGIGLGFYNGTRFHIDSRSFRRWGADGRSKTSPCAQYDVVME